MFHMWCCSGISQEGHLTSGHIGGFLFTVPTTSVKIIFKNLNMGIEIVEKSKETRVKQASMLNTQRSLFGLNG